MQAGSRDKSRQGAVDLCLSDSYFLEPASLFFDFGSAEQSQLDQVHATKQGIKQEIWRAGVSRRRVPKVDVLSLIVMVKEKRFK